MMSFTHYFFRSLKLFLNRHGDKFKPIGWTRWGMVRSIVCTIA